MGIIQTINNFLPLLIFIFVLTGTTSTVSNKVLYDTTAVGDGVPSHSFNKPWFMDLVMFIAMTFCLVPYYLGKMGKTTPEMVSLKSPNEDELLPNGQDAKPVTSTGKLTLLIFLPALCDTTATYLMNVGLLWISASIWQMLRGTIILFTALLRMVYLGKKTRGYEWCGIGFVIAALAFVGIASINIPQVKGDDSSTANVSTLLKIIGLILVILSQGVQALQTVIEEKLLHDVDAEATFIVGLEGVWGILLCGISMVIVQYLPGDDGGGIHEDSWDTLYMIKNNGVIIWIVLAFMLAILFFNFYGMKITEHINSTTRNLLDSIRTLVVWIVMLIIHCFVSTSGELWAAWSWMQFGGFIMMVLGMFIYNVVLRFDGLFEYDEETKDKGYAVPLPCFASRPKYMTVQ